MLMIFKIDIVMYLFDVFMLIILLFILILLVSTNNYSFHELLKFFIKIIVSGHYCYIMPLHACYPCLWQGPLTQLQPQFKTMCETFQLLLFSMQWLMWIFSLVQLKDFINNKSILLANCCLLEPCFVTGLT